MITDIVISCIIFWIFVLEFGFVIYVMMAWVIYPEKYIEYNTKFYKLVGYWVVIMVVGITICLGSVAAYHA